MARGRLATRIGTVRHRGFYIALAAAVVVGAATLAASWQLALLAGVNVFFAAYLVIVTSTVFRKLDARFLRRHADEEDAPALVIFLVMVGAVVASAGSFFLILAERGSGGPELALSLASVVLGWLAVHTMWAMHYAYEYYHATSAGTGRGKGGNIAGGLEFAGGEEPDGTAFLYFSYVIGMTAQTSDTGISSNAMRRIVTVHGIFAFFFNTVIVAAAVNIAVSLAH